MIASFQYSACYCEENIWQLAQEAIFKGQQTMVAMISGHGRFRRFWYQRSAEKDGSAVYWDYHVVLLSYDAGWWVWDLDTTLDLPLAAETYCGKTFLNSTIDVADTDVFLRLVPADEYVQTFSSDRAHMRLQNGEWLAPPPSWPAIQQGEESNLLAWLDVNRANPGQVYTLAEFRNDFLKI